MRTRQLFDLLRRKTVPMLNACSYVFRGILCEKRIILYPLLYRVLLIPKNNRHFDWAPFLQWRRRRWRRPRNLSLPRSLPGWSPRINCYFMQTLNWPNKVCDFWSGNQYWSAYLWRSAKARLRCVVVHAEHFSANVDDQYILWNNYHEYQFLPMQTSVDFFFIVDWPPKKSCRAV